MFATGKLHYEMPNAPPTMPNAILGIDFSGVLDGKRIMSIYPFGCISLQCKVDPDLTWEIPDHWTLEDAATIPVVYCTVSCINCWFIRKLYKVSNLIYTKSNYDNRLHKIRTVIFELLIN